MRHISSTSSVIKECSLWLTSSFEVVIEEAASLSLSGQSKCGRNHQSYLKGSRCTDKTCYLSDCATIKYVYCFKGKFRVRVGVDG